MRHDSLALRYWGWLIWRERLVLSLLGILISGTLLAAFLAHTLIVETQVAQLSFAAFYLRSVSILFFLLILPFYFIRLHHSQEIAYLLTQACSRSMFLLQTLVAFILFAFTVCVAIGLLLILMQCPLQQTICWSVSLLLECSILLSWTLFLSTRLTHAIIVSLFVFLFYCLGRMHTLIMAPLLKSEPTFLTTLTRIVLKLVPAFDQFTQTDWFINTSNTPTMLPLATEAFLFMSVGFILALITYQKRWL